MRFILSFKTGAPVEFDIPEAALKRHPETMLSVMSRPRWAGPEGTPEVQRLEAPETAETYWSDGMAKAVVTLYARETGDQSCGRLVPGVFDIQAFRRRACRVAGV